MELINLVLDYIGRTNLFNFIIFFSVFVIIFKKAKLSEKLENAKVSIVEEIDESTNTKTEAENRLSTIEESMSHLEEEVDIIVKKSEENANLVGEKILEDAKKTVEGIKENSLKAIENKTSLLKNDIMKRASIASVEVAKKHIINELNNNQDLHNRLIDESVEALEGIEL